ncbi:hypothetical protein D3C86_2234410 [compost metagenome]
MMLTLHERHLEIGDFPTEQPLLERLRHAARHFILVLHEQLLAAYLGLIHEPAAWRARLDAKP